MDIEISSPWQPLKHISGEQRLFQEIILQAMDDIRCEAESPGSYDNYAKVPRRLYADTAISWIFSNHPPMFDDRAGVTFRECCDCAGFDPQYWRSKIRLYIARHPHLTHTISKKKGTKNV
jgi:hypothetical protein